VNVAVGNDHIEVGLVNINAIGGQGVVSVVVAASHVTDAAVTVSPVLDPMARCL